MKIVHVISGLNDGGAEGVLFRLIKSTKSEFKHEVICFLDEGKYGRILESNNIKVTYLRMSRSSLNFFKILRIYSILKFTSPDVVQTWMYHSDLIGGIFAKVLGVKKIFWNIRSSSYKFGKTKFKTILLIYVCGFFSWFVPSKVIINSKKAINIHRKYIYKNNFTLIYNGIDPSIFKKNDNNRNGIRKKLVISESTFLIGCIARFDPQKDHLNLLKAIHLFKAINSNFRLLLIGKGITKLDHICNRFIKKHELIGNLILLENQPNIFEYYNSLDLFILPSLYGEGFPNVLGEAMSSEIPCISTNIGDSEFIIPDKNFIIAKNNPNKLYEKIVKIYNLYKNNKKEYEKIQFNNRKKIINNFNIDQMVDQYSLLWRI